MDKQEKANQILQLLKQQYPQVIPPLNHRNVYELLIATMLSPQTTDAAVNKVTPALFAKYPNAHALAAAKQAEVSQIIRPLGFYNTKSKNLIAAAKILESEFNGQVPRTISDLIKLPGVGRKVASVVLYQGYGINEGFTVDTHVLRLSGWLGLSESKDPAKVEQDLMQLFPQDEWGDTSLRLIFLGRELLTARNPKWEGTVWAGLVVE